MQLGRYAVLGELGRGGMGVVLRARAPDGTVVAIKLIHVSDPDALARFERERRLLGTLGETEGFVPLLEAGSSPRGPWFAMPLVEGGNLAERLERGPLPVDEAVRIARAVAAALGRAHAIGIVHRDIKPANVLFSRTGQPLVADLGLARHYTREGLGVSQSVALTRSGEKWGTLGYAAPEQLQDMKRTGPASDVYSVGVLLWECLAGRRLFQEPNPLATLELMRAGAPSLRTVRGDVPPWVDALLARALAFHPEERHADGKQLALAFDKAERPKRSPLLLVGAAALAVVLGTVGGFLSLRDDGPRGGAAPPGPVAPPGPPPPAPPPRNAPPWYLALAANARPALPLPRGLRFGDQAGEYVNDHDGSVLVFVPGGVFTMGFPERDDRIPDAYPSHEVELSPCFMGKLEVTRAQFERFVAATSHDTTVPGGSWTIVSPDGWSYGPKADASWRDPVPGRATPGPDHPVTAVRPGDADAYAAWAGLRLPTEAEWERAAGWDSRARMARPFPWGERPPSVDSGPLANVPDLKSLEAMSKLGIFPAYDDGYAWTAPVGTYPNGASPSGALDMVGNAAEWCADDYDATYYALSPRRDPLASGSPKRVVRGGSYWTPVWYCNTRARQGVEAAKPRFDIGFRVARDAR